MSVQATMWVGKNRIYSTILLPDPGGFFALRLEPSLADDFDTS